QYVEVFESLILRRGGRPELFYERCQLSRQALDKAGATISGEQLQRMLISCRDLAAPDRPVSAQLLEQFPLTAHGTLGIVILTSPDLNAALDAALKFYPVVMPAFDIRREDLGDQVLLVFQPLCDFGEVAHLLTETILGAFNSIRRYINPNIRLLEIHL